MINPSERLTDLMRRAANNEDGAKQSLYTRVYDDLCVAAHRVMRSRPRSDLETTDLVNEVVIRFESKNAIATMANRRVFFSVAIRAMNQIMVDHYRRRQTQVDSPDRPAVRLDDAIRAIEDQTGFDVERLQIALASLASDAPRQHSVISYRFLGGLSIRETAELLQISEPTVERDWRLARAKLFRRLRDTTD